MQLQFDRKTFKLGLSHVITIPMKFFSDGTLKNGETYHFTMDTTPILKTIVEIEKGEPIVEPITQTPTETPEETISPELLS